MKKISILAVAFAASLMIAAPAAMASGITVDVHTHADNIGQLALSGADAANSATSSADEIASLGSLNGNYTGNVNMSATVDHVIQLGASVAISDFASPGYGTANASADGIAGLVSAKVNNVDNGAWINTAASADHVVQADLAIALAGYNATSSALTAAGLDSVTVNLGN